MEKNFCDAITSKNEPALGKIIDRFVSGLDTRGDEENNFLQIKTWLQSHDCIESVQVGYGMLRSEPPIKEFHIKLANTMATGQTLTIGIRCFPDKLKFHSIN